MASVAKLDEFGFLAVTGKDAATFLQGYTTCDVDEVNDARTALGAMCNLQGRMVNSFRLAPAEDGLLLRLNAALIESTREFLGKYIVFSRAETADESGVWQCFGVVGDGWGSLPGEVNQLVRDNDHYIVRVSDTGPRFEIWAKAPLPAFDGMDELPGEAWRRLEIRDGLAWVADATREDFIPQMFNYDQLGGISFTKGCYLGQEIVARMQHRGQVKRRLFRGEATDAVRTGEPILNEGGKNIGTVVSAAPAHDGHEFLAVVQTRGLETGARLEGDRAVELEAAFDTTEAG